MSSSESESGDEYYDELEPRGKRSKHDDRGYILRNVLKLPRATTYTTQALYGGLLASMYGSKLTPLQSRSLAATLTWNQSIKEVREVFSTSLNDLSHVLSDVVWPESKQVGLIDSILRNFYIPPVIFGEHIILRQAM